MNTFKVGEKVEFIEDYDDAKAGDVGVVIGPVYEGVRVRCKTGKIVSIWACRLKLVEDPWAPKVGEMVEAKDDPRSRREGAIFEWAECRFIGMDHGYFVCRQNVRNYKNWDQIRPISLQDPQLTQALKENKALKAELQEIHKLKNKLQEIIDRV